MASVGKASGKTPGLARVSLLFSFFGVGSGVLCGGAPSLSLLVCLSVRRLHTPVRESPLVQGSAAAVMMPSATARLYRHRNAEIRCSVALRPPLLLRRCNAFA